MRKKIILFGLLANFCMFYTISAQRPPRPTTEELEAMFGDQLDAQIKETAAKSKIDKKLKPYNEVITNEAVTDEGLITVHKIEEKYYFEIPDSLFNKEILLVTRAAKLPSGTRSAFGGNKEGENVIVWKRKDNDVFIQPKVYDVLQDNFEIPLEDLNVIAEPFSENFPILAIAKDSLSVVIDVTKFLEKDSKGFQLEISKSELGVSGLDSDLSFIKSIKSFPINLEIRILKTYKKTKSQAGEPNKASVELNTSMILLPEVPMKPRLMDNRVGWFSRKYKDFGTNGFDAQKKEVVYIDRWRLEVKDEDIEKFKRGELVEPKKPIVFYLDRATPKEMIEPFKKAIESWQSMFEVAGFKNAIIAKLPPTVEEDPEWSPEDARYSVVRYLASPIPNANGPHVSDPRTGEIIESDINWFQSVGIIMRNMYFVQTAAANPKARKLKFEGEVLSDVAGYVLAHEVGHALGLPHNMGSSFAYTVENLRDPEFTSTHGTAPSIMDYARWNYVAQPGDGVTNFSPGFGEYDSYSINWGYRPILDAKTPEEEVPILNKWILKHDGQLLYRFGPQQIFKVEDPSSNTEDLTNDNIESSNLGIRNLQFIMLHFEDWVEEQNGDFDDVYELYKMIQSQYKRYLDHVKVNVGGTYRFGKPTFKNGAKAYEPVPSAYQKASVAFFNEQLFTAPEWLFPNEITDNHDRSGDVVKLLSLQKGIVNDLISEEKLKNLFINESLVGTKTYTVSEMISDLRKGIFSELYNGKSIDVYRRAIQRALVSRLTGLIQIDSAEIESKDVDTPEKVINEVSKVAGKLELEFSDAKLVFEKELRILRTHIMSKLNSNIDKLTRTHLEDLIYRIENSLNQKA